jgi:hypothetical protein
MNTLDQSPQGRAVRRDQTRHSEGTKMVELRIDGKSVWTCDSSEKGIATLIAFAKGTLESVGVTKELPTLTPEVLPAA